MRRPALSFLFALVLSVSAAIVSHAFAPTRISFVSCVGRPAVGYGRHHDKACIFLQNDDSDDDSDGKEQENANKPPPAPSSTGMTKGTRPSITPMFYNWDRAIYAFGILFLVSSWLLESFGYSYVVVDKHFSVNTLDYRNFQNEVIKAAKEEKKTSFSSSISMDQ
jgi:hypothetical protein